MVGAERNESKWKVVEGPYINEASLTAPQQLCDVEIRRDRGSRASPCLALGASPSFRTCPAACGGFTGEKVTPRGKDEGLQWDTSKKRHSTVSINNQTKM